MAEDVSDHGIVQIQQIGDRATAQFCGELAARTQQQGSHLRGGLRFIKVGDTCPHRRKPRQGTSRPPINPTVMHCRREHVSRHRDYRGVCHRNHVPRSRLLQQRGYRATEFTTQGKSENRSTAAMITEHSHRSALNQMHLPHRRTPTHESHAGSNISPTAHRREECDLVTKGLFARHPSPPTTGRIDRCRQSSLRPRHARPGVPIVARRPRRCPGRKCSRRGPCRIAPSGAPNWLALAAARLTSRRHELGVRNERPCPSPDRICCSIRFHGVSLRRASRTSDQAQAGTAYPRVLLTPSSCPWRPGPRIDKTPQELASVLPGCSAPGCGRLTMFVGLHPVVSQRALTSGTHPQLGPVPLPVIGKVLVAM
jgi:hypothetical protein